MNHCIEIDVIVIDIGRGELEDSVYVFDYYST